MTVENIDIIDALGIEKDTGEIILTISDHLPWNSNSDHFEILEKKIGRYLDFIQSGQLVESIQDASKRRLRISIFCKHEPDDHAYNFLKAAERELAEFGIAISLSELPPSY